MTIKELMSQVDTDRVAEAYVLIDYHFSDNNFEVTLVKRFKAIPKLRNIIKENIQLFKDICLQAKEKKETLFIMEVSKEEYGESWKKKLESFVIQDEEMLPNIDRDFRLFNDDGDVRINHYAYDMSPTEEIAGYIVAKDSIETLGPEICAAHILSTIFFFGFDEADRKAYIEEIIEDLKESEREIESGNVKSYSADEFFAELEDKYFSDESEDEKAYRKAEKKFKSAVKDIKSRHLQKIFEEKQQLFIDAIRKEYQGRA